MKKAFLTSGPRGSGKSEFVQTLLKYHPEVTVISRDEILISLFGSTMLSPYSGEHSHAFEIMLSTVAECLASNSATETVILDCWNGFSSERKHLIKKLREAGADKVFCLQFFVPVEFCIQWFKQKSDGETLRESSIRWDYELYYKSAESIHEDGFDQVITVNQTQLRLPGFPFL